MVEVSPTLGYAVPRIWEKYYLCDTIRMAEATWFKRMVFGVALTIGKKRAGLKMDFQKVPVYLEISIQTGLFCRFSEN